MDRRSLSFRYFITVLFKRKRVILSVFLTVFAFGMAATLLMSPVYLSESKILVERKIDSEKAILLNMNLPTNDNEYNWINSEPCFIRF